MTKDRTIFDMLVREPSADEYHTALENGKVAEVEEHELKYEDDL